MLYDISFNREYSDNYLVDDTINMKTVGAKLPLSACPHSCEILIQAHGPYERNPENSLNMGRNECLFV